MKIKSILKKTLAVVLSFAMLSPIMANLDLSVVRAEDINLSEVLSVKCQVTNGIVTNSNIDKYRNKYVLRFVSSIENLEYTHVGFEVSYTDESGTVITKTNKTKKVFNRIESTTGFTEEGQDEYSFGPKVISAASEYLITAKLPVAVEDIDVDYTVRAFGIKMNGQTEYGPKRCVSVEDGLTEKNRINVSVDAVLDEKASYTATYVNASEETVTIDSTNVKVLPTGEGKTSVRLSNADKNLTSVTEITIKDSQGNNAATATYRNLYTKYTGEGTEDKTWCENYDDQDTFVIATSADLYGFADLVNTDHKDFANKKVYLASDIAVNSETLVTDSTDTANYKKWYTYDETTGERVYKNAPAYTWASIGYRSGSYYSFKGEFDGNMHTISGLYNNAMREYGGFFGPVQSSTKLRNFKLKNSYFKASTVNCGSITGYGAGLFDTIYSNAIVESELRERIGGLVGAIFVTDIKVQMNNCWFDGSVINSSTNSSYRGTGGILGTLYSGSVKLENCLNTGIVDASAQTNSIPKVGGLIGDVAAGTTAEIMDCLNTGNVLVGSGCDGGTIVGCINGGKLTCNTSYGYGNVNVAGYYGGGTADTREFKVVYDYNGSQDTSYRTTSKNNYTNIPVISLLDLGDTTTVFKDENAVTNLRGFDFDSTWSVIPNEAPVLKSFETEVIDYSWYDEDEDVYTLYDKADLYGFAEFSQTNDFAHKTITLGNDIVVNNGDSRNWETAAPKYTWWSIGDVNTRFAGTFDGNMHTISGLYFNTNEENRGLFAATSGASTIKNLYLKNSYFESTEKNLGGIAGQGRGKLDTVYSNAIIKSDDGRVGGLIGMAYGTAVVLQNCWNEGSVTNTAEDRSHNESSGARGTGGLIGEIYSSTSGESSVKIENCLNQGTVDVTASTETATLGGGFVGSVRTGTDLTIVDSLNLSDVKAISGKFAGVMVGCVDGANLRITTSYGYGVEGTDSIVGWMQNSATFLADYYYPKDTLVESDNRGSVQGNTSLNNAHRKIAIMFLNKTDSKSYYGSISGTNANTNLPGLDFDYAWKTVDNDTPVLRFVKDIDTSWYDANKDTYVLYDKADLYGLAVLSQTNDFAGKIVQLGNDIVVNEGLSTNWSTSAPKYSWTPIGNATTPFAGTFDGQGHKIYGVYSKATAQNTGLFGVVGSNGIVQNVKLMNSYFESSGKNLGSIAGQCSGKIYMVYSDANVLGKHQNIGGILGYATGSSVVMENCWFDGNVKNAFDGVSNNDTSNVAGLVGLVYSSSSMKLTLLNCLNTGEVDATAYTEINPCVGGLIGRNYQKIDIDSCVSAGNVLYNSETATVCYGPIIGYNSGSKDAIKIANTYVTQESCECDKADATCQSFTLSNITATYNHVNEADIKNDAKACMPSLGWDEDWKMVANSLPEIIFSNTGFGEESDYVAKDTDVAMLNALYSNRSLLQGDLHAHSLSYTQDEDGENSLTEWNNEIENDELELDFVASLLHKQTIHIEQNEWIKSKFIYGTEASTANIAGITGNSGNGSGKLHYNMLFATKEQMVNVLTAFPEFNYDSSTGRFSYPNTSFTRQRFTELIKKVIDDEKGFFVIPHPSDEYTTVESILGGEKLPFSDKAEDYYFTDGVGLEVISKSYYNNSLTEVNYQLWKELLNMTPSKRVYACSGSDTHATLAKSGEALTSIYAKTCSGECTDTCANEGCAKTDKGNIIPYLSQGDFTAGAVGIQMCMGDNTSMGGSCDFTDKRLVVRINELHKYYDHSNIYRVDILNEDGIVYSQQTTFDGKTVIALDAEDCNYYRVEVYNVNNGRRIAIGNPIWNDR